MDAPVIAGRRPAVIELEAGTYWWCACGRSAEQPFCDRSHKGTGLRPVKIELEEPRRLALCQCKHTASPGLCDGTHARLE